ncbi:MULTISPECIES: hypothetical protein [Pseudomonas]|uniref:Transposase n=1 Tax=Pseudomonas proteolytica TaxID=219574 RepID=A0AAW5A5I6_9PSED|nr:MULTISPECIES: hypothetical protein [Pseudomonas]KAA0945770.1 hypothetical protein FQ182_15985 [Pseudomonas sp. ANT_H4]KAA0951619.1 hypothetical protein FQ186_15720 [Pseudomonas sp. ANT_H14]KAA8704890.1 hypothetical protein F4W61_05985 [Pseudomonas proteolytica]MCF5056507.1 hypothetical protein [Pseudomonas proteolytica]MCF5101622.1 hypothetical protein [Pseudomonas proteolytica]
MTRSRNLTPDAVEQIVSILDGWSGKLTWDLLIISVARRLRRTYTRQALHKHEWIKRAFMLRKQILSTSVGTRKVVSSEVQVANDRIARLEGENGRLKMENDRLLEQFVRWAYNAYSGGLDEQFLSRPLPVINRKQTP